jgi:hypothetical protein
VSSVPDDFREEVERRRREALNRVLRLPIAALIWGPTPSAGTPVAAVRTQLRDTLADGGHLACFSEEMYDSTLPQSNLVQQLAQVEAFDIVFSVPDSPGSIAEIHDFSRIPTVSNKIVTFLNQDWNSGYANQSLLQLQSTVTCQIQVYKTCDLPDCIIKPAMSLVGRLQEFYYLNGRRF